MNYDPRKIAPPEDTVEPLMISPTMTERQFEMSNPILELRIQLLERQVRLLIERD